jgi:hypothetical protein
MKAMLRLIVLPGLLAIGGLVNAAPDNQQLFQSSPDITSFTTTAQNVVRASLTSGTARIPVQWTTVNRPIFANLIFEQVFNNGSAYNVELPRLVRWVNSSDKGIAAPISPDAGADHIRLRVRLVNIFTRQVYDEAFLDIPIVEQNVPRIAYYTSQNPAVDVNQLLNGVARIPVSWSVDNRPDGSNLVFEQVMHDGSIRNVELPRANPWVSSSGVGIAAPFYPTGGEDFIRLQARLVWFSDYGATIDRREFTLPLGGQSTNFVEIPLHLCFNAPFPAPNNIAIGSPARVRSNTTVSLYNAPLGSYSIGTLPAGTQLNVTDGPYCFRPADPNQPQRYRRWQATAPSRNLSGWVDEYVMTTQGVQYQIEPTQINLPPSVIYFTVSPPTFTLDQEVTISWFTNFADSVEVTTPGKNWTDLPIAGEIKVTARDIVGENNHFAITLIAVDADNSNNSVTQTRWVDVVDGVTAEIISFTAQPSTVSNLGEVTLHWEIRGAVSARIRWVRDFPDGAEFTLTDITTNTGSHTAQLSGHHPNAIFHLNVTDDDGREITETLYVNTTCAYSFFVNDPAEQNGNCPESAATSVNAAYQRFERGFMVWDSSTDRIAVFVDNGTLIGFIDAWNGEEITFDQNPPDGKQLPQRGFGAVWVNNANVRAALGWATGGEQGYSATRQQINQPRLQYNTKVGAIYIRIPDQRTIRYHDDFAHELRWTFVG